MILILSRGHYCSKDFQQHRQLVELYPEIAVAYTQIVTISTDTILHANEMRQSLGAHSGSSSATTVIRFRATSTSPNTPTPATTQ
jgi:hypothetical protein